MISTSAIGIEQCALENESHCVSGPGKERRLIFNIASASREQLLFEGYNSEALLTEFRILLFGGKP